MPPKPKDAKAPVEEAAASSDEAGDLAEKELMISFLRSKLGR